MCCIYVFPLLFQIQLPSCGSWPGRVRRAVHLNTSAKLELQWSVRLGKSWLTTAHHLLVTSLDWSYDVATHSNDCSKHLGNTLHNRTFGCTWYLSPPSPYWTHVGAPYHLLLSSWALLCAGTTRDDAGHWRCLQMVVDRGKSMPPRQPSQRRLVWRASQRRHEHFLRWKQRRKTEDCGLAATADRAVPDFTTPALIHLTVVFFCIFILFYYHHLCFPLFTLLCIYRHDFPNRVSHSLPFSWIFVKKWCIARRLVRPRLVDYSFMLSVFLSLFKSCLAVFVNDSMLLCVLSLYLLLLRLYVIIMCYLIYLWAYIFSFFHSCHAG